MAPILMELTSWEKLIFTLSHPHNCAHLCRVQPASLFMTTLISPQGSRLLSEEVRNKERVRNKEKSEIERV